MEIKNEQDKELWDEMIGISDRTSAIVCAAYLEDKLTDAIEGAIKKDKGTFRRLFKQGGALGGLVNKALIGYMLNLYSKELRDEIEIVSQIRNKFAHWAKPVSFETKEIEELCKSITYNERVLGGFDPWPPKIKKNWAKFRYITFTDHVSFHFVMMVRNPDHPKVL